MKSKQEKQEFLKSIKNEMEIHNLLEEILPEMGFSDVKITHEKGSRPEFGKDLICSMEDKIENKKDWYAFVVKKGAIRGTASAVREIKDQVSECFEYPYKSIEQKKKISISKVKVVTNMHVSSGAEDKIFAGNLVEKANIDFWGGEKLIELIDRFYPKYWIRGSKQYKKYIERLQNRIKTDSFIKSLNTDNKKVEKLLSNMIEPKLSERITLDDGSIKWVKKKPNTIIGFPDNSIIVGEPGCGKTTLFKTLSEEIITQNSLRNNNDFYPIILTFKEIELFDFSLEKTIENYFKKDWNVDLQINHMEILQSDNCAIFIDALDELPNAESKENALKSIKDFNSNNPKIKIVCSSRPSDYLLNNYETIGFRYLEISDLNRGQIELFLNNYFSDNITKSKSLLKSLKDSEILEKLPKTPLTIALITMLFDEKEVEIPATITSLYEQFVSLLIGKSKVENTTELIEIGIKHRLLSHLAKYLHKDLKKSISQSDFRDVIKKYSVERGQKFDIDKVLGELIEQVGLLYRNDKGDIEFKHQSFQEYFTAYEIFHHRQADKDLFINKFNDLWWQNVAIFYGGMGNDSPGFLEEILAKNKPSNLKEYISNTGGIGKLLQALYNTPIEQRSKGIQRGLDNTISMLDEVINNEKETNDIIFFKNFSKYGLMQIFGSWFKHNNWSITLKDPLGNQFDKIYENLDQNLRKEDIFNIEFKLFLTSSILASDSFIDFERFKKIVDKSKLLDIDILATFDSHYKQLMAHLPKSYRKNEDLRKIESRLKKRMNVISDFDKKRVDKPIKDIKFIKK